MVSFQERAPTTEGLYGDFEKKKPGPQALLFLSALNSRLGGMQDRGGIPAALRLQGQDQS
jgi:hypothetical protein